MSRPILISIIILVVLIAAGGWFFFGSFGKPLYTPGKLAAMSVSLDPPSQEGVSPGFWKMEDGILIHHFEDGVGDPVLVLHGGPGFPWKDPWDGLEVLNGSHRFVYYHQRGCGKSTRPVESFTSKNYYQNMQELDAKLGLATQLGDIERVRRILGQEKLTLIGHSFGGFLAVLYAVEFPERVEKLLLISPAEVVKMPPVEGGLYEQVKGKIPAEMEKEYGDFLKRYFDYGFIFSKTEQELAALNLEFTRYYLPAYEANGNPPSGEAQCAPEEAGGWVSPALFFGLGQKGDLTPYLKQIKVPVRVIAGGRDLMPVQALDVYLENLPNAELQVIPNGGHFSFNEAAEEFAALAGEFLGKREE